MQNVMQALYLTRNVRGLPASARRYTQTGAKKQTNEKCRFIGRFSMPFYLPDVDELWLLNDKSTI
jgi:hypothetical protein